MFIGIVVPAMDLKSPDRKIVPHNFYINFSRGQGLVSQVVSYEESGTDAIPALTVHDTFIVPVGHDGYIQELMGNVFRESYGCNIAVEYLQGSFLSPNECPRLYFPTPRFAVPVITWFY